MDSDLEIIRAAMRKTQGMGTLMVAFFVGLATLSFIRFAGSQLDLAFVMGGMCLALAGLMFYLRRRMSADHNPAARALLDDPQAVTDIEHYTSSSSTGLVKLQWLKVRAHGKTFGMRVPQGEIYAVTQALKRRCPNAKLSVPRF